MLWSILMIYSLAVSFLAANRHSFIERNVYKMMSQPSSCDELLQGWNLSLLRLAVEQWPFTGECSTWMFHVKRAGNGKPPKKESQKTFGVRIPSVIFLEGSFFGCWCFFLLGSIFSDRFWILYLFCLHLASHRGPMDSLQVILVTTAQPTLVCGREGSVDVSLRAPHVSKAAASTGIKHTVIPASRYTSHVR